MVLPGSREAVIDRVAIVTDKKERSSLSPATAAFPLVLIAAAGCFWLIGHLSDIAPSRLFVFFALIVLAVCRGFQLKNESEKESTQSNIVITFDVLPSLLRWLLFMLSLAMVVLPHSIGIGAHISITVLGALIGGFCGWLVLNTRLTVNADSEFIEANGFLYNRNMLGRNRRPWNDLHSVRLRQTTARQDIITFYFHSGGNFSLPLCRLTPVELEKLMILLAQFADPLTLNSDVVALQKAVLMLGPGAPSLGFTHFWQDSFQSAYSETNFVPLNRGHRLREGNLSILMLLSSGGAKAVYLCRDASGQQFILKELSMGALMADDARQKHVELFTRESQILARIDHPRIVKVLDAFVEGQRQYMLLQFVPGITLSQFVNLHGAVDSALAANIATQTGEILQYLHELPEPIIHRDIAPDNLIIDEENKTITLIDFGAANEVALLANSTVIGKQCYIAPEQLRGAACIQSDLFSLGATMFFILTGKEPEPISTSIPSRLQSGISPQLNTLVEKLTAMETKARPQSAREFLQSLRSGV